MSIGQSYTCYTVFWNTRSSPFFFFFRSKSLCPWCFSSHMASYCFTPFFADQEKEEQRSCQEGPWACAAHPLHQLCPLCPQGQGHQEVCHQEHCGGSSRERHLRGQRLWLWVCLILKSCVGRHCKLSGHSDPGGFCLDLCSPPLCSVCPAQALCEAALLCQLCHPQQGSEEPLLWGQERPYPTTQIQARCEYHPRQTHPFSCHVCSV